MHGHGVHNGAWPELQSILLASLPHGSFVETGAKGGAHTIVPGDRVLQQVRSRFSTPCLCCRELLQKPALCVDSLGYTRQATPLHNNNTASSCFWNLMPISKCVQALRVSSTVRTHGGQTLRSCREVHHPSASVPRQKLQSIALVLLPLGSYHIAACVGCILARCAPRPAAPLQPHVYCLASNCLMN